MFQDSVLYAYLPAKDVTRARAFYEGTLGFTPKREFAGGVYYEFAAGTSAYLYPTRNAGTSKASQVFWAVNDIEAKVAELKRRGVTLEHYDFPNTDANGITTEGGVKAAWFKDTEGTILALIQTL